MASNAYTAYLDLLLQDAEELEAAHKKLRTGKVGRQWGLGALNRGVVVLAVSAWEAYIEELVKESVEAIRPSAAPMGTWPALNATARSQIGRFNNPNPDNVRSLFADTLGLADITVCWCWQGVTAERAWERLAEALRKRHEIAHGSSPRPRILNQYAKQLPGFFRRLGKCTDEAVRDYVMKRLGIAIHGLRKRRASTGAPEALPNSSQQPTRGRSLARRFRASCFVASGVSLAGT
jgi:hypothetical protein